jgi:CRP-like cAMP-binding protein
MVKTFVDDSQGNEQVLGFSLPGEVIGLNAIHGARFPATPWRWTPSTCAGSRFRD